MLAQTLQMTIRGVPCIYYGDEIGLAGGAEPYNRTDMQWNNVTGSQIYNHLKNLITIRKKYKALRQGTQMEMWADDNIYAYSRLTEDHEVIVIINNSGNTRRNISLRAESKLANGTVLVNLLKGDTVTVQNRALDISINMNEAKILVVK